MERFEQTLVTGAREMGFSLDPGQVDLMVIHGRELLAWNKVTNLTALKDPSELAEKQFLDALSLVHEIPADARVLDVGSGGGFPGIPLKIVRPDLHIMLIDARRKKVSFLKHVIRDLDMANIEAHHVRAEDLAHVMGHQRVRFDTVVSKAVADLSGLFEVCWPQVHEHGRLIAMQGQCKERAIKGAQKIAAKHQLSLRTKRYFLPFSKIERTLFVLERRKSM